MANININAFTENASRLGMRIQETLSEHTRDLSIGRGSGALFDVPDEKLKNIGRHLDSTSDREKLDAMKRLIAMISKGRNVSNYFPQVVKNVASHNLEMRKLVYIYLLRYAEQEPELALLSINTFQKDLTDTSPLIRSMALRVLSGIKVPMIGSIVVLAIKKCSADVSPYVRKAAALAIPKCYHLDSGHQSSLLPIISALLRDRSHLSIGSSVVAFEAVCPTRLDLLHKQYRRLCRILVDVDEWGQVDLMNLLMRYARTMLQKPIVNSAGELSEEIDADLQLLLNSAEPLFLSRNPSVVLAAAKVFYYLGPPSFLPKIAQPLLRIMYFSKEVERVVLAYLLVITRSHPTLFSAYYSRIYVRTDDVRQVKVDKIRLLLNLLTAENHQPILREFIDYAADVDDQVVAVAARAIGRCARLIPDSTHQCLTALMTMIRSKYDSVVSNSILVLRSLVQNQLLAASSIASSSTQSPLIIISQLARRVDNIRHPQAKACVIWLVGQYAAAPDVNTVIEGIADWAPDVLRKTAKSFIQESTTVKLQVLTLAAKLFLLSPEHLTLGLLTRYVFSVARYDLNYDVRDRTRMLSSLLSSLYPGINGHEQVEDHGGVILRREQAKKVLFEGKTGILDDEADLGGSHSLLGSLGLITGKDVHGDSILPEWLESGIEPMLRESEEDVAPAPFQASGMSTNQRSLGSATITPVVLTPTEGSSPPQDSVNKGPWTDLEKFYENDSDENEESEGSDEDDADDMDDNIEKQEYDGDDAEAEESDEVSEGEGEDEDKSQLDRFFA